MRVIQDLLRGLAGCTLRDRDLGPIVQQRAGDANVGVRDGHKRPGQGCHLVESSQSAASSFSQPATMVGSLDAAAVVAGSVVPAKLTGDAAACPS
jgi:hypothetical protein